MDDRPKHKPEAPETTPGGAPTPTPTPTPTATAKGGARPVGGPTLSQKLWGTADFKYLGETTDEIMAALRGQDWPYCKENW